MRFEGVHAKLLNQAILIASTIIQNSFPSVGLNGVTIGSQLQVSNQVICLVRICLILLLCFYGDEEFFESKLPATFSSIPFLIFSTSLWVIRSRITGVCCILKIRVKLICFVRIMDTIYWDIIRYDMTARYCMHMICYRISVLGITYSHKMECPYGTCITVPPTHVIVFMLCTAVHFYLHHSVHK